MRVVAINFGFLPPFGDVKREIYIRTNMPPKKRKAAKAPIRGRRQPEIQRRNEQPADYYNEMLSEEAGAIATSSGDEGRTIKKRRTAGRSGPAEEKLKTPTKRVQTIPETPQTAERPQQAIYDDYRTDESDVEFEDVELDVMPEEAGELQKETTAADRATDLSIAVTFDADVGKGKKTRTSSRLSSSTVEKQKRVDIHKVHLCCLLAHVYTRNAWCNDEQIQVRSRKPVLTSK